MRRDVLVEVIASKLPEGDWVESRSETETETETEARLVALGRKRSQAQKALKQRRIGKRVAPKKYGS